MLEKAWQAGDTQSITLKAVLYAHTKYETWGEGSQESWVLFYQKSLHLSGSQIRGWKKPLVTSPSLSSGNTKRSDSSVS